MEVGFKGKRALVTGAGKGLGRAIARALWAGGATVYALSRTQSDLDSLCEECSGIRIICVDLADWNATRSAVENIGAIDLLVNNAGIDRIRTLLEVTENDFDDVYAVNVKAIANVSQIVARGMIERKYGAIVNVSSIYSARGTEGGMLYNTAQGALDQLTRCMAVELGPHKVRVNSVLPTLIPATNMGSTALAEFPEEYTELLGRCPLQRHADVQDVVNGVMYLLSDKADMVNGVFLPIDGGWMCT